MTPPRPPPPRPPPARPPTPPRPTPPPPPTALPRPQRRTRKNGPKPGDNRNVDDDDLMWTLATSGAAIAAAMVARKGLARGWERKRGAIPTAPGDGTTSWSEAVMWAVLSGVVVGVAAQLGDLMESIIKRDCARKDASAVVPGFGGVLDVLDSLLFAAPVAFGYWLCLGP